MRRAGESFGGSVVISAIATVLLLVAITGARHPVRPQNSGAPPWPAPPSVAAGAQLAGLTVAGAPGVVTRYTVHLDVLMDGKAVQVPAGVGANRATREITALYTDDGSGVVHIDSDSPTPQFTLREFFDEWQVPLTNATAFVNGSQHRGDPGAIVLTPHEEIAVAFGSQGRRIADRYVFPGGE
jgi:hypothetical protein